MRLKRRFPIVANILKKVYGIWYIACVRVIDPEIRSGDFSIELLEKLAGNYFGNISIPTGANLISLIRVNVRLQKRIGHTLLFAHEDFIYFIITRVYRCVSGQTKHLLYGANNSLRAREKTTTGPGDNNDDYFRPTA